MVTRIAFLRTILQSRICQSSQRCLCMVPSSEMRYSEKRLIGYSREEIFSVVADVSRYRDFVPWCRNSSVLEEHTNSMVAELEIGFQLLNERYTSRVTHVRPSVVHSECTDLRVFRRLDTMWRFGDGRPDCPRSATMHFDVTFEFQSALYRSVTHLFFDQVVLSMVTAFLQRAEVLHGPPSFPASKPDVLQYKA